MIYNTQIHVERAIREGSRKYGISYRVSSEFLFTNQLYQGNQNFRETFLCEKVNSLLAEVLILLLLLLLFYLSSLP